MTKEELMKCCTKGGAKRAEVAVHYFPSYSPENSVTKMRRWIKGDRELRRALRLKGYRAGCHHFYPGVVRVFVEFFGYERML